jgi:AraC-like DNA-binding protein
MAEILQKSANLEKSTREQRLIESGILAPAGFDKYFSVKGYTVSEDLAAFVSHYWIMRWDVPEGMAYSPTEILSAPVSHAFFTTHDALLYNVFNGTFDYEASGKGVIAGITFRAGGFYPFLGRSMATLTGKQTPLATIFTQRAVSNVQQLLAEDNEQIVLAMEALLHTKDPATDSNVSFINNVIDTLVADGSIATVEEVAKQFHKSERTLQHLFKMYTGVGVKWAIMRIRLLGAVKLAYAAGRPNWAQLAADLGYSSQAHFINDFKRVVGKTPAQFIKSSALPA